MLILPRRRFLAIAGAVWPIAVGASQNPPAPAAQQRPTRRADPLGDDLVLEFVWRGHFDPEGVRRMLSERPSLLNAAFDWGNGDYEMAIGGAGHMGRRDIAEYLLAQGSRADIFVSAMLGRLDVVKAYLAATPSLLTSKGPHGIPLLRHAIAGGEPAAAVADYLRSLGAG